MLISKKNFQIMYTSTKAQKVYALEYIETILLICKQMLTLGLKVVSYMSKICKIFNHETMKFFKTYEDVCGYTCTYACICACVHR